MDKNKTAVILFTVFLLYGVIFILNSSFTVGGERYFTCKDDVMITLNYARNIVRGHGFVWFPGGERVEGASSLLWVIVTAAVHLILDSDRLTPGLVQLVSLAFLLMGTVWLYRLSMLLTESDVFTSLAISGVTFFYSALFFWSIMGFEVSLAFALISIVLFEGIRELKGEKSNTWLLCILFALLILARNELVVFCILFLVVTRLANIRALVSSSFFAGVLAIFLAAAGITLFRFLYFNEILPNTYYLKMTGYPLFLRMTRGLYIAILFLRELSLPMLLVYFYGVFVLVRRHGLRIAILLTVPLFMYIGYSIYVGADAWEYRGGANRWIAPFMGLFVICTVSGCRQILDDLFSTFGEKPGCNLPRLAVFKKTLYWVLLLTVYLQMNLCGSNPTSPMMEMLMLRKAMGVPEIRRRIMVGHVISEITHKHAKIGLIAAGTIPYHTEDRHFVDLFGYNDKILSKQPGHIRGEGWSKYVSYGPGLVKYDIDYSVGRLQPDVLVNIPLHDAEGLEKKYGHYYKAVAIDLPELNKTVKIWLRKDSPKLRREKLIERSIFL